MAEASRRCRRQRAQSCAVETSRIPGRDHRQTRLNETESSIPPADRLPSRASHACAPRQDQLNPCYTIHRQYRHISYPPTPFVKQKQPTSPPKPCSNHDLGCANATSQPNRKSRGTYSRAQSIYLLGDGVHCEVYGGSVALQKP